MSDIAGHEWQPQEMRARQAVRSAPHMNNAAVRGDAEADLILAAIDIATLPQAAKQIEIDEIVIPDALFGVAEDPARIDRHPLVRRFPQPAIEPARTIVIAMGGEVFDIAVGGQLSDRASLARGQPRREEAPLQPGHGTHADLPEHLARIDGDARCGSELGADEAAMPPRRIPSVRCKRQSSLCQAPADGCWVPRQDRLNSPTGAAARPRRWATGRPPVPSGPRRPT